MGCLDLSPLKGSPSSQADVFGVTTPKITVGFHGHDGASTTEFIVVLDFDDALFEIQ